MSYIVSIIGISTRCVKSRIVRIIQLDVRKQGAVYNGFINNKNTQDAVAFAI